MTTASTSDRDRRIRSVRPAKPPLDAWRPAGWVRELERTPAGDLEAALTVFLTGSECPFTCVFCDLWRHTLDESTPAGSLPAQIETALASLDEPVSAVKLYNASNFFDPRAVPDNDIQRIVECVGGFDRVTVESHPRLIGRRCRQLASAIDGRLEVAMGLETVHPQVLPRLNKQMTVETFDRAALELRRGDVGLRAFVLVGVPFLTDDEQVEWAVRSVDHAASRGAERVSLIPVRPGNGELERLEAVGEWRRPTLEMLEEAFERSVERREIAVTVDTWDLERLNRCPECHATRCRRLGRMNRLGVVVPRKACAACGWS